MFIKIRQGVVLISVLMIILILSAIGSTLGGDFLKSLKRSGYLEFQSNSIQLMRNIENLAVERINQFSKLELQDLNKKSELLTFPFIYEVNGLTVTANLSDFSSCFNINSLVVEQSQSFIANERAIEQFKRLLISLEISEMDTNSIIDQIIDWIDTDDQPRANGFEDYFYTGPINFRPMYTNKRLLINLSELNNLPIFKDLTDSILFENVCVHPLSYSNEVNINTMDVDDNYFLTSIFPKISLTDAEFIISKIPENGFKTTDEFISSFSEFNLSDPYSTIKTSSKQFLLSTSTQVDTFSFSSRTFINIKNGRAIIMSRSYNIN